MDSINTKSIRNELKQILTMSYVTELWIVGSLADKNTTVTETSDVDIICKATNIEGTKDELMSPESEKAQQLFQNPKEIWDTATEGIELTKTITVTTNQQTFDAPVHLIAQPTDYNVDKITGGQIQLY